MPSKKDSSDQDVGQSDRFQAPCEALWRGASGAAALLGTRRSRRGGKPRRARSRCRSPALGPRSWGASSREGPALVALFGANKVIFDARSQLRVRPRILVQRLRGLRQVVQIEVALDELAGAPVGQRQVNRLALFDVAQHEAPIGSILEVVLWGGVV